MKSSSKFWLIIGLLTIAISIKYLIVPNWEMEDSRGEKPFQIIFLYVLPGIIILGYFIACLEMWVKDSKYIKYSIFYHLDKLVKRINAFINKNMDL